MKVFSGFDFAKNFSLKEVAALVGGLDPLQTLEHCDFYLLQVEPILQRLMDDFDVRSNNAWEKRQLSRAEVISWISSNGFKSVYQFDLDGDRAPSGILGRWPWGNHHTEMLGHLEAAAHRFWKRYDPSDKTTAPTNREIIAWLIERKVSKSMAEAMATILRIDGLPPGPRK